MPLKSQAFFSARAIFLAATVLRQFWDSSFELTEHNTLTLIPTGMTIYGSRYFKAKFLKKVINNINF